LSAQPLACPAKECQLEPARLHRPVLAPSAE
jgi:hypothetical protein